MQPKFRTLCTNLLSRRFLRATAALGLLSLLVFAQTGLAQTGSTSPLNFGNNYFVTGDYVVGGVGLRGLGVNGFATGTINIPDKNSVPSTGVPPGADIVGAFLYWETVESSQTAFAGQQGFFRGYQITGVVLGNPNAPVSWSSGGCSGNAQGSKTMRAYRADVLTLLPVDSNGTVQPNNSYQVRLADSGSNGGAAPLTLGATLVIIYRVLDQNVPLNSVVIYDGAFAPANGSTTMTQPLQGFYQAAASPISKLTHIVGNGQNNKFETVSLNNVALPSLYGSLPSFPGYYNGSWDNPTWSFSGIGNPVHANDASATTAIVPAASNSGCVSWGTVILSTTVQNSDNDGILDVWKQNQGYCDASVNGGVCSSSDPSWVALPGATSGQKDVFIQLDSTCSVLNSDGTCDPTNSFLPPALALTRMTNAFSAQGIHLHLFPTNVISEQELACSDSTSPTLCPFPGQPGVVGWKSGFTFLKNEPLNYPDESSCEAAASGPCIRRFQHGRKDSYHYVLAARALGTANWAFQGGSLVSVVVDNNGVATFTTTNTPTNPIGLVSDPAAGNGRVTVADAITSPNLNGTYLVTPVNYNIFSIQTTNVPAGTYNLSTDPDLAVASGTVGTGSGVSDVGGADSLITLGLWGADATENVQAGTVMHELGHSLALTHGGFYYDIPNSYVATVEPNCKPNFQSVMNYLFQVDLLDNGVLDYSRERLIALNESGSGVGITTTDGLATFYSTTKWYALTPPGGVGNAATRHCDGTPILPADPDPTMFRVEGSTTSIVWNNQDINFDGQIIASLRGYNDWANLDPRQIGATGSLSVAGGITKGGTGITKGGTGITKGGSGITKGGTGITKGGSGITKGGSGVGNGELTSQQANSVTRPPRSLTAIRTDTFNPTVHSVSLSWTPPTFGQVTYNVYRNGAKVASALTTLNFTDSAVSDCTTYTYIVSSVLVSSDPSLNGNESVPSNSVQYSVPCPPTGLTAALTVTNGVGSIALNWAAASTASGAIGEYKVYRDDGSGSGIQLLNTVSSPTTTYTDQPVINNTTYTYYVTAASTILNDLQGCLPGQYCRESSAASTTILVSWRVDSITTITSISPSPSILGQPLTVSVTVSPAVGTPPPTPTGTVTVSDSGGTICTITLSGGSGSCTGTPSILIGGLAAVGTRAINATYGGDLTFNGSSGSKNQQVIYNFNGFLTPLKLSSYSGSFNFGKTIPIKWQLKTYISTFITMSNLDLTKVSLTAYFNGQPIGGSCPVSPVSAKTLILFNSQQGAAGGSTFRYDTTNNQYIFNWDTSKANFGTGCYTLSLQLDDGSTPKTTSLQLK